MQKIYETKLYADVAGRKRKKNYGVWMKLPGGVCKKMGLTGSTRTTKGSHKFVVYEVKDQEGGKSYCVGFEAVASG